MRVRTLLGYGLDVLANHRLGTRVISTLRSSIAAGDNSIESMLMKEAMEDEQTLIRVWEWMIQSERLNNSAVQAGFGGRKQRFTGILALLMPGGSLTAVAAAVTSKLRSAPGTAPTAAQSPTGTVLSILKNEGSDSSSTTFPVHSSSSLALSLSPPSQTLESSASNGFLPAGFRVYLSEARAEAMRLCEGWFDLFADAGNGQLSGAPGAARRRAGSVTASVSPSAISFGGNPSPSPAHAAYEAHLVELEARGLYEQAARVAVCHLDLERALQSLTLGAKQSADSNRDLGLVAMALSGYANFAAHAQQQSQQDAASSISANQLWNQTWTSALGGGGQHLSPSLKVIFSFLSSFAPKQPTAAIYSAILESDGLPLQDKLGFVLRFLPDEELIAYLVQLARDLVQRGDLDGLMLTGLNNYEIIPATGTETAPTSVSYTMDLLQSYLNRTSDVQTAAVLGCFAGVSINFAQGVSGVDAADPSTSLSQWLQLYKSLLNQWSLWPERAKFDVARALLEKTWSEEQAGATAANARGAAALVKRPSHHTTVRPQISVRCNFCGQSLSLEAMSGGGGAGAGPGAGHAPTPGGRTAMFKPRGRVGAARGVPDQNSVRIRGCPHCKKSLPRCALCLVSFDCDTPHGGPGGSNKQRRKNPLVEGQEEDVSTGASGAPSVHVEDDPRFDSSSMAEFGRWFTWCQACRHGGHAEHMSDVSVHDISSDNDSVTLC